MTRKAQKVIVEKYKGIEISGKEGKFVLELRENHKGLCICKDWHITAQMSDLNSSQKLCDFNEVRLLQIF